MEGTAAEWRRFTDAQGKAMDESGQLAEQVRASVGAEAALLGKPHQILADLMANRLFSGHNGQTALLDKKKNPGTLANTGVSGFFRWCS